MKKILGISLIAMLAALPTMANAADGEPVAGDPGQTAQSPIEATYAAGYTLALQDAAKDSKMATAGYVKGAYNAAIKAINRVAADKQDVITDLATIKSNAAAGAGAAEKIGTGDLATSATTLIGAINELKSSALTSASLDSYVTSTSLENAGYITSAALEDYAKTSDLDSYVTSTSLENAGYITSAALEDYAKTSDLDSYVTSTALTNAGYATTQAVKTAIDNATTSVSVEVLTTWGTDAESTVVISGTVSAAE